MSEFTGRVLQQAELGHFAMHNALCQWLGSPGQVLHLVETMIKTLRKLEKCKKPLPSLDYSNIALFCALFIVNLNINRNIEILNNINISFYAKISLQ